jgi:hypothetical protein
VGFDPREGSKDPGLLIDTRTGKTVSMPGKYEVISIKDGAAELIRYRKTDLWLMPVKGGCPESATPGERRTGTTAPSAVIIRRAG